MKNAGLLMVTLGFLAACLVAVMNPEEIELEYFIPAFLVGVLGVVLARIAISRESKSEERLAENLKGVTHSLARLADNVSKLNAEKQDVDVYDFPAMIDETFAADIDQFIEAREAIAHQYGVQPYAEVMTLFSSAERALNRVWSCSVDGYIDEAHTHLERASSQFEEARVKLNEVHGDES